MPLLSIEFSTISHFYCSNIVSSVICVKRHPSWQTQQQNYTLNDALRKEYKTVVCVKHLNSIYML